MQDGPAIGDGGEEVGGKGNPGDDDDAGPGDAVISGSQSQPTPSGSDESCGVTSSERDKICDDIVSQQFQTQKSRSSAALFALLAV